MLRVRTSKQHSTAPIFLNKNALRKAKHTYLSRHIAVSSDSSFQLFDISGIEELSG